MMNVVWSFFETRSESILRSDLVSLLQVGPGMVGAGAAVALAARITGGQTKEDTSIWVSSAKLDKTLDQKF